VACRNTLLGEGHRQKSAVARNERFSLALRGLVRQDRRCSAIDRFSEPVPPSVGALVFLGLAVFRRLPPKSRSDTVPQKTAVHKTFRNDQIWAVSLPDLREGYRCVRCVNPAHTAAPVGQRFGYARGPSTHHARIVPWCSVLSRASKHKFA
jgi:hypothetical protein